MICIVYRYYMSFIYSKYIIQTYVTSTLHLINPNTGGLLSYTFQILANQGARNLFMADMPAPQVTNQWAQVSTFLSSSTSWCRMRQRWNRITIFPTAFTAFALTYTMSPHIECQNSSSSLLKSPVDRTAHITPSKTLFRFNDRVLQCPNALGPKWRIVQVWDFKELHFSEFKQKISKRTWNIMKRSSSGSFAAPWTLQYQVSHSDTDKRCIRAKSHRWQWIDGSRFHPRQKITWPADIMQPCQTALKLEAKVD